MATIRWCPIFPKMGQLPPTPVFMTIPPWCKNNPFLWLDRGQFNISDHILRSRKSRLRGAKAQQDNNRFHVKSSPIWCLFNLRITMKWWLNHNLFSGSPVRGLRSKKKNKKTWCLMETMIIVDTEITKTNHVISYGGYLIKSPWSNTGSLESSRVSPRAKAHRHLQPFDLVPRSHLPPGNELVGHFRAVNHDKLWGFSINKHRTLMGHNGHIYIIRDVFWDINDGISIVSSSRALAKKHR